MRKHHREILKHVRTMCPNAEITQVNTPGHFKFVVQHGALKKRFIASNTPNDPDICVRNAVKDVALFLNLRPPIRT